MRQRAKIWMYPRVSEVGKVEIKTREEGTNWYLDERERHLSILFPESATKQEQISTIFKLGEVARTHFHLHTKGSIKRVTRVTVRRPDLRAFERWKEGRGAEGQI